MNDYELDIYNEANSEDSLKEFDLYVMESGIGAVQIILLSAFVGLIAVALIALLTRTKSEKKTNSAITYSSAIKNYAERNKGSGKIISTVYLENLIKGIKSYAMGIKFLNNGLYKIKDAYLRDKGNIIKETGKSDINKSKSYFETSKKYLSDSKKGSYRCEGIILVFEDVTKALESIKDDCRDIDKLHKFLVKDKCKIETKSYMNETYSQFVAANKKLVEILRKIFLDMKAE